MKPTTTFHESVNFLAIYFIAVTLGFGQSIFENEIQGPNPNTDNPYIINQVLDPNISCSGIGRGSGITGKDKNNEYKAKGWASNDFNEDDYFEFTITPNIGYKIDFGSFQYTPRRNNGSVNSFDFRSSIDSYASSIVEPIFDQNGVTVDLSSFQDINEEITFRLYAWGAAGNNKTFSIKDFVFNGVVSIDDALSLGEQLRKNNALSIIEYQNGEVKLKLLGNLAMKSIQIIDLQGRILHNLKANGDSVALRLNILRRTIYVAKVELTDGRVITKKAIKRY